MFNLVCAFWSHLYLVSYVLFLYCDGFLLSSPDLILGGSYRTQIMLSNSGCASLGFTWLGVLWPNKCQKVFFKSYHSQALHFYFRAGVFHKLHTAPFPATDFSKIVVSMEPYHLCSKVSEPLREPFLVLGSTQN